MHVYKVDIARWLLLNSNQLLDSEKAPPHTPPPCPLVTSSVKSGLDLVVFFWNLEPLNSHKSIQLSKGMAKSHPDPTVNEREVREKSVSGTRSLDPPLLPVMVSPLLRKLHGARGRALIQERHWSFATFPALAPGAEAKAGRCTGLCPSHGKLCCQCPS